MYENPDAHWVEDDEGMGWCHECVDYRYIEDGLCTRCGSDDVDEPSED
jgi:hypothetical protein